MFDVMVSVSVSLVLLGLMIPGFGVMMQAVELDAAGQEIAAELGLARMRAAAKMTTSRVTLDPADCSVRREVWDPELEVYQLEGAVSYLPEGAGFELSSPLRITFNSRGIAVDDAGVPVSSSVTLSDGSYHLTLLVSSSGEIKTQRSSG